MIGERLANLRKDKKLNQKDLADQLGISVYTVSSYERENSAPDDEMKVNIAKFFNISLDYLLGLIDDERPIGGGRNFPIPDNLPSEAVTEIHEYIDYIKVKYKNK